MTLRIYVAVDHDDTYRYGLTRAIHTIKGWPRVFHSLQYDIDPQDTLDTLAEIDSLNLDARRFMATATLRMQGVLFDTAITPWQARQERIERKLVRIVEKWPGLTISQLRNKARPISEGEFKDNVWRSEIKVVDDRCFIDVDKARFGA